MSMYNDAFELLAEAVSNGKLDKIQIAFANYKRERALVGAEEAPDLRQTIAGLRDDTKQLQEALDTAAREAMTLNARTGALESPPQG